MHTPERKNLGQKPKHRLRLSSRIRWLADREWLLVTLAAPFLLFPTVRPILTLAALALLTMWWVLRWLGLGEPWPTTPLNGTMLVLAATIAVGIWVSAFPEVTLPKATGLVLGLAAFRSIVFLVKDYRQLSLALLGYGVLGTALVLVGTLSVHAVNKVPVLTKVADQIPTLISSLPELGSSGVSTNQLAGTILLFQPLALSLAWAALQRPRRRLSDWLPLATMLALGVAASGALLLTQSRSGWVGSLVGVLALGILWLLTSRRRALRRFGVIIPLLIGLAAVGVVFAMGPENLPAVLYGKEISSSVESVVGNVSLAGRVEIWSRALYAIQDFAFTGCGLGTFRKVVPVLYPLFLIPPNYDIAHAHNIFLQTGVDLGIPGLIGYLGLLMTAAYVCWQTAAQQRDLRLRATAIGLLSGLVALHTYGLTDALAPGSKPGLVFWYALGLLTAMHRLAGKGQEESLAKPGPEEVT